VANAAGLKSSWTKTVRRHQNIRNQQIHDRVYQMDNNNDNAKRQRYLNIAANEKLLHIMMLLIHCWRRWAS